MTSAPTPPPVLNGGRVLAYASLGSRRRPSAEGLMFVENKPLGPVSALAITETPSLPGKRRGHGVLLLYCTRRWSLRGVAGYKSLALARRRAEIMFPGSSARWVSSRVTKAGAERYLDKVWAGLECSFCGRRPDQVERVVAGKQARICDQCVLAATAIVRSNGSRRGA